MTETPEKKLFLKVVSLDIWGGKMLSVDWSKRLSKFAVFDMSG